MKRRVLVVTLLAGAALLALFAPALLKLDVGELPDRAAWSHPGRVVRSLDLAPSARVADIGAGGGYFTFHLADALPSGSVYATDVAPKIVEDLRDEVRRRGYDNIEVLLSETSDAGLPESSIDLALICDVYHHIDDRVPYFDRLRTSLTPRGRVAIIEVSDRVPVRWLSPPGHSTPAEVLEREMGEAGYRVVERFDFLPFHDFVVFAPDS